MKEECFISNLVVVLIPSSQYHIKVLAPDDGDSYAPLFVRMAWQCANTFRQTDYMGGCNGARLRLEPQISWPANAALDSALELLQPVKDAFGADLTWADLIALAGTTALEVSSGCDGFAIPFTGGRSDATAGEGLPTPDYLQFQLSGGAATDTVAALQNAQAMLGLSSREMVALMGGGHTLGRQHKARSGFLDGKFTTNPLSLDNEYFKNLVDLTWTKVANTDAAHEEYSATTKAGEVLHVLKTDMLLVWSSAYKAVVEEYSLDNALFLSDFANVWVKVMNADMF
jgi:catalase (peroxidase I)